MESGLDKVEPAAAAPPGDGRGRWLAPVRFWLAKPSGPRTYTFSRWLFLRLLGLIYLLAFGSLWLQIEGLLGPQGILPVGDYLPLVEKHLGSQAYWRLPTFSWLSPDHGLLQAQCGAGVALALLLLCDVASLPATIGLWALYLSLSVVGREFLSYQWDALLLETGFLAMFLAPRRWFPSWTHQPPASRAAVWLARFLLFKLMFSSGLVKLLSGDVTWRNLTALDIHYQTQPLPTWIGWYAHQLPAAFQHASVLIMFVIELAMPWLIFAPRRLPLLAALGFSSLMVLISATGNYCFFNLLTVVLCLLLVDDETWLRGWPRRWPIRPPEASAPKPKPPWRWALRGAVFGGLFLLSASAMLTRLAPVQALPSPALWLLEWAGPLRTFNAYGLFAVMTTTRHEIVVEGSLDGLDWRAYEFKWKPGDVRRRPGFVAPHQPRLDWQMWFAALGSFEQNPWFHAFLARLLQGSPPVLGLLAANPFPAHPPLYVRAVFYEYRFTTLDQHRQAGAWWRREKVGMYCTRLSLRHPPQPTPARRKGMEI
jgi:hypothetical protein